jgi:SAM-dependent methyltransferase
VSPADQTDRPERPRHPSAGNLDTRPTLVADEPQSSIPSIAFPEGAMVEAGHVAMGPDLEGDAITRLLGHLDGKRVLELGCSSGDLSIVLARNGAKVIAVDQSMERITEAREAAEIAEVKVEFHHGDLADLAFVRNEAVDLAISVYALAAVPDLDRVFRQVHRVLRSDTPFLFSLPHPLALMGRLDASERSPRLERTYFDTTVCAWQTDETDGTVHPHRIGDVVTSMARSNFRVDLVSEPRPVRRASSPHWTDLAEWVPTTFIVRGRRL